MRLLFLSGVDVGGAPRSTIDLARALAQRGHEVVVVLGSGVPPGRIYDLAVRALVKLGDRPGHDLLRRRVRRNGGQTRRVEEDTDRLEVWQAPLSENALPYVLESFRPEVVVANSLPREQLRWVVGDLASLNTPLGLYLRERHALTHLTVSGLVPDVVLANSRQWAELARSAGSDCVFAPSLVDLSSVTVESTRAAVVLINPVSENRPEILRGLARRRQDIKCVLQESWPLDSDQRSHLLEWAGELPNLEYRTRTSNGAEIYRDARVLLATYPSGRPRVVAEAQHNGIPVVGLAQPSLDEAIGGGGLLIEDGMPDDVWIDHLSDLWDDQDRYEQLVNGARRNADRDEIKPEEIVSRVESALRSVIR
jgi:glycosyltransferase involved in cell wall biosynthesis